MGKRPSLGKLQSLATGLILLSSCTPQGEKVYCPKCHKPLYVYQGEIPTKLVESSLKDLIPINGAKPVKRDSDFKCPKDSAPLNGWKYWFWDRSRHEPVMVYPAETFMIKKGEEFIFYPDSMELGDI